MNQQNILRQIQQNVGTPKFFRFRDRFIGDTAFVCEVLSFTKEGYLQDYQSFIDAQQLQILRMQNSTSDDIKTLVARKSAHIRFIKQSIFKALADLNYI